MSAASIIRRVRTAGGEITLADERIRLKVPASLRDEAVAEIRAHRDAIKRALEIETGDPWDALDNRYLIDERAGIAEFDGAAPKVFATGFARLQVLCPAGVEISDWRLAIDDSGRFLDRWGDNAAGLGWKAAELFEYPSGLAWQTHGRAVAGIEETAASLDDGDVIVRGADARG